ncbi:MAG: hypothetical protein P1V21_20850 [Rhizobiaceae bacterium]|nr:hypothetical protein [Rhizobiaceae bacterium]
MFALISLANVQTQLRQQLPGLVTRDCRTFELPGVDKLDSSQISAPQVSTFKTATRQIRITQTALFENTLPEIAFPEICHLKIELLELGLAKGKTRQPCIGKDRFFKNGMHRFCFRQIRPRQLAPFKRCRRQRGAAEIAVVEIASLKSGFPEIRSGKIGKSTATTQPLAAFQFCPDERGPPEDAIVESPIAKIQPRERHLLEITAHQGERFITSSQCFQLCPVERLILKKIMWSF